jgi:hypothetical protein
MPYQTPPDWNDNAQPWIEAANLDILSNNQIDYQGRITALEGVDTIAALKALTGMANGAVRQVRGYYAVGDGGGGTFRYDSGSSATDNGGTIIAPDTGSGRWLRIYSGWVDPLWFGAKGDGVTNDAAAIQAAINAVYALGGGKVRFANKTYKVSSPLTSYQTVLLEGNNTTFYCTGMTTPGYVLTMEGVPGVPGHYVVARNIYFKGNDTISDNPVSYTADLTAIRFKSYDMSVDCCNFTGFDKAVVFTDYAYIITFQGCNFRYNNRAVYYSGADCSIAGEKIVLLNCTLGNNNYGVYNLGCELCITNCSLDYNRQNHIYNDTQLSGFPGWYGGGMVVTDCHLESSNAYSAVRRIVNHGLLSLKGGTVFDDKEAQPYIDNYGQILIGGGINWLQLEDKYLIEQSGLVRIGEVATVHAAQTPRFNRQSSGVRNNGFETGDLTGWTLTTGSNAASSSTQAYLGTRSLRIASTSGSVATTLTSEKVPIKPGTQSLLMSFFFMNAGTTVQPEVYFRIYALDGSTVLSDVSLSFAAGNHAWSLQSIAAAPSPNGGYYDIRVSVPQSASANFAHFDEFYVRVS